jgi:DNA adenine methylase
VEVLLRGKEPIEPFIRWAGGKQKIINKLLLFLPQDIQTRNYKEPFLGAGSLFFATQPTKSLLSDANEHLINCYKYVKSDPDLIYRYLVKHSNNTSEDYYYKIRKLYNESIPSAAQSARFIYLNKTCFNGIFRVNKKNEFNVPYGWKEPPSLPSRSMLKKISNTLKKAKLQACSFISILNEITTDDFIYLDPPYPPLNGTSYFTHYTKERFGNDDQVQLSEFVHSINDRGAKFMMSNADTELIRDLYKKYNFYDISVTRWITCKSKKHKVSELVITNYDEFYLF